MTREEFDGWIAEWNCCITDDESITVRRRFLNELLDRGMHYWMDPNVQKIKMWKMEERKAKGQSMIDEECERQIRMIEEEGRCDCSKVLMLLDAMEALLEFRL